MKKIFTLSAVLILLATTSFSQSQEASCPQIYDIKRNNGGNMPQGPGTCGGDAQIRVYFDKCPSNPPRLDSIYYEGKKIQGLTFGSPDVTHCDKPNAYISYCVYGSNIPPAKKLTFYFTYKFPNGNVPKECEVPEGGPLPVSLSAFLAGRTTNSSVSLSWKTESEVSVGNYEIQRSFDNSAFTTVGVVASNGNSSSVRSYSFIDNSNNTKNVSFYRLKIVNQNGAVTYSDIKTVKGVTLANKADFILFPNPSFGNAKVTITDLNEPTIVQFLDNSGRLIKSIKLTNSNTAEVTGLSKGSYLVRIQGTVSGETIVKKLSVIN